MALAWVVLGVLLVAIELHHLAFYALFGALAAFAAALVALVAPGAVALQLTVAIAATSAGIVAVRPFISRAYDRHHRPGHVARGVHGGLVGQEVLTLDVVGDAHRPGHVRLAGERWLAVTLSEDIPPGTRVMVNGVRGTTLVVFPVDWLDPSKDLESAKDLDSAKDNANNPSTVSNGESRKPPRATLGGVEEAEEEST